jgi:hypothetical protein
MALSIASPPLGRRRRGIRTGAVLVVLLFSPAPLRAQVVEGTVTSGDTGAPIRGAVVRLLDARGDASAEGVTDDAGAFSLRASAAGRYRLRAERVGYESVTSDAFDLAVGDVRHVPLVSAGRAITLEGITVEGGPRRCRLRPEGAEELARVWEEARKALHVVALTEAAGRVRFDYETHRRELDPATGELRSEQRRSHFGATRSPFHSVSAERLAERGFVDVGPDSTTYYAPDAGVLLSDVFLDGHCFQLHPASSAADGRIGLDFRPVRGASKPDIEGTLWLDRKSSELREVEYRFVRLPVRAPEDRFGGRVAFQRVPSGAWIVEEWSIRMPLVTVYERWQPRIGGAEMEHRSDAVLSAIVEEGGEVRSVRPAGERRSPGLGSLAGVVTDSLGGGPLVGAKVYLSGTSFAARTDDAGRFRIPDVPAGTYLVSFLHPAIGRLGYLPDPLRVQLRSDEEASVDLAVPSTVGLLERLCPGLAPGEGMITGTVRDADGPEPLEGARVRVTRRTIDPRITAAGEGLVLVSGTTRRASIEVNADASGRYRICGAPLTGELKLSAARDGYRDAELRLHPEDRRIVVRDVGLERR